MKDAIFAALPIVCALAFGWAFDAWDAERKKRKQAEFLRDFFQEDARNCVKLLREANAVLVDLANAAGECGRLLLAWNSVKGAYATDEASGLTLTFRHWFDMAKKHDAEALDRLNGILDRFHEYAERNNLTISEMEEHEKCK